MLLVRCECPNRIGGDDCIHAHTMEGQGALSFSRINARTAGCHCNVLVACAVLLLERAVRWPAVSQPRLSTGRGRVGQERYEFLCLGEKFVERNDGYILQ
jgi:hypothetical protein